MIITFDKLNSLSEPVTYVIGTFDILHAGHIHFLEQAKLAGESHKLLVGIIPDKIVRERKGSDRPVIYEEERAIIVDALKSVDFVFIAPELPLGDISRMVIDKVHPEFSVVSKEDWENRVGEWQIEGTKLIKIDKIQDRSTTKIVQKIKKVTEEL